MPQTNRFISQRLPDKCGGSWKKCHATFPVEHLGAGDILFITWKNQFRALVGVLARPPVVQHVFSFPLHCWHNLWILTSSAVPHWEHGQAMFFHDPEGLFVFSSVVFSCPLGSPSMIRWCHEWGEDFGSDNVNYAWTVASRVIMDLLWESLCVRNLMLSASGKSGSTMFRQIRNVASDKLKRW